MASGVTDEKVIFWIKIDYPDSNDHTTFITPDDGISGNVIMME